MHISPGFIQELINCSDTGGPVLVSVNIYLRSISKIDDVNMEYSTQFTFREEWYDARLAYERLADENTQVPPFVVLAASEQADLTQQIWMPDTFFQNEKFVFDKNKIPQKSCEKYQMKFHFICVIMSRKRFPYKLSNPLYHHLTFIGSFRS